MPILGGLFSKKSKPSSTHAGHTPASYYSYAASEIESSISCTSASPSTEYINADKSLPSSPNGKRAVSSVYPTAVASSSRLKLHFGRRKGASSSTTSVATHDHEHELPPRPSYASRTGTASSDTDAALADRRKHLRPPPSRSAIFAAYADPTGARSTRSLPSERVGRSEPPSPPLPPIPPQKRSLFNWSKSQPKQESKSTSPKKLNKGPPVITSNLDVGEDLSSFNLKSFRHVTPVSPTHSNASNTSISALPLPRPRPRGTSIASDSSQRISVAAFREAQARRSQAGSPSPSIRSPSPGLLPGSRSYSGTDTRSSSNAATSHYHSSPIVPQQQQRRPAPRRASVFADDSDTTASSSEEEDSDDERPQRGDSVGRRRTLTQRSSRKSSEASDSKARARSELGHGSSWRTEPLPKQEPKRPARPTRPPLSAIVPSGMRPTTSASVPVQALNRTKASPPLPSHSDTRSVHTASRHVRESSAYSTGVTSTSDSDTDSDNAPLARLVPPRRPGSGMSSASGSRSNVHLPGSRPGTPSNQRPPPLIDISTLSRPKPTDDPFIVPRSKSNDIAFTKGPTLVSAGRTVTAPHPSTKSRNNEPPLPQSFILPPHELDDGSSRFVSSPTSTVASSFPSPPLPENKSGSSVSATVPKNDTQFPSRKGSKDWLASPPRSPPEAKEPSRPLAKSEAEKPREMISERLTRVLKQTTGPPTADKATRHARRASSIDITSSPRLGGEDDYFSMGAFGSDLGEPKEKVSGERGEDRIAPIVIKERLPPSSFAVTSRPQHRTNPSMDSTRQRSTTLHPSSAPAPFATNPSSPPSMPLPAPNGPANGNSSSANRNTHVRQRSSTMTPLMTGPPNVNLKGNVNVFPMPTKPFAKRGESPASSTGDSSSGRAPLTPMDGSEVGSTSASASTRADRRGESEVTRNSGVSGLRMGPKGKATAKRRSVTFEDPEEIGTKEKGRVSLEEEEARRKERRRSEAKAAIELGNVINGRGPIMDDEDDEDDENQPINQAYGGRMGMMKNMMGMGPTPMSMPMGSPGGWNVMGGWPQAPSAMLPSQFMMPPPPPPGADANFLAAHQQAMLIAKQAYQMAVAQQAMAAAADEWERGSAYGGGGGSVYGGGSPSVGYGMGMPGGWQQGGMMFPPSPRSMYGGVAQSEYGGGSTMGGGWGTRSVYGETFGPAANNRASRNVPKSSHGHSASQGNPLSPRDNPGSPGTRSRTTSQPTSPGRPGVRRAPPPSSWKAGV
ncbi:hypothetical protein HGRIS_008646 [Hohenbuehelia grisea]|uniref:Uncharacterized protein n=1 Tax=Hohenbuehelia grisea TaxID=104357 RepID=A0ABR3J918_9AGAR